MYTIHIATKTLNDNYVNEIVKLMISGINIHCLKYILKPIYAYTQTPHIHTYTYVYTQTHTNVLFPYTHNKAQYVNIHI